MPTGRLSHHNVIREKGEQQAQSVYYFSEKYMVNVVPNT